MLQVLLDDGRRPGGRLIRVVHHHGFTRLYLAVHFVSDVVAGLIAAAAWVSVCVSGMEVGIRETSG
ncbi:MAG TPA: hypothetical protein VJ802_05160 [Gemmatimonadaceae bacterium]|nr:hypothetical protein [Gemmatimonadaceae bacterium]